MKRLFFMFALLVLPAIAFADGGRSEQDFIAANELALKGDLNGAIALYQTLLSQGVEHEDLYFNLGHAQAQAGKYVDAVLSFERALRLAPNDVDTRANLELLRAKIAGTKPGEAPAEEHGSVVLADVVEPLVAPFPRAIFGWLAAGLNVLLFGCLLVRRRSTRDGLRKAARAGAIVSLFALVFALTVVLGHFVVARDPRAVVTEAGDVKEGPHVRFKVTGHTSGGERVRVIDEDGSFVKVLRKDGSSGWIASRSIVRV